MSIVYVASPFAGDIEKNQMLAIKYCQYAIKQGVTPIAPHLLYPQMLDDNKPEERATGLNMGLEILDYLDELWVCGDRLSDGMRAELRFAIEKRLPIRLISDKEINMSLGKEVLGE